MKGNNMSDNKNVNQDKGLQGNEKIEQAIAALQQEATQEMLAHTLTVIRRRMREKGQFILSVEPPTGDNQLRIAVAGQQGRWYLHTGRQGFGMHPEVRQELCGRCTSLWRTPESKRPEPAFRSGK